MKVEVDVEAIAFRNFLNGYPRAMEASVKQYRDRIGLHLKNVSTKIAPRRTSNQRKKQYGGYLRQNILYNEQTGILHSHAAYSKYVHGAPFYKFKSLINKNGSKRKITPFFTWAIRDSRSFIRSEQKALLNRVLK